MMPELDGISLLRAALEIDPNLVGIIMTGAGTIATAVAALQTGALDTFSSRSKLRDMLPVLARARIGCATQPSGLASESKTPDRGQRISQLADDKDAWRAIGLGVVRTCNGIGNTLL